MFIHKGAIYPKHTLKIHGEKNLWIQKMTKDKKFKESALRKHFKLKNNETLTITQINKELQRLKKKYPEGGYSDKDLTLSRQLNAAKNMMKIKR